MTSTRSRLLEIAVEDESYDLYEKQPASACCRGWELYESCVTSTSTRSCLLGLAVEDESYMRAVSPLREAVCLGLLYRGWELYESCYLYEKLSVWACCREWSGGPPSSCGYGPRPSPTHRMPITYRYTNCTCSQDNCQLSTIGKNK